MLRLRGHGMEEGRARGVEIEGTRSMHSTTSGHIAINEGQRDVGAKFQGLCGLRVRLSHH